MPSPFLLSERRAIVSIGPVSSKRHCPYQCPFCYVESTDFVKYKDWGIDDTIDWLIRHIDEYDIVYVSGDTDSFAPPRTNEGIELLARLVSLHKDVMFTTRYVFSKDSDLIRLREIASAINSNGKIAIACVSVCQLNNPELEPRPISPPRIRIQQIGTLRDIGWISVLAMRPILPIVPLADLLMIMQFARAYTKYCLIAPYFYSPNGKQLKIDTHKVRIGQLYFNIGDSIDWYQYDIPLKTLDEIRTTAHALEMEVYDKSMEFYFNLK